MAFVGLSDFYAQSLTSQWVSLKSPDPGFKSHPTCPTYRGPITPPRYNRATKRALIDIQEQHAITNLALDTSKYRDALVSFDLQAASQSIQAALQNIVPTKSVRMADQMKMNAALVLFPADTTCIPYDMFAEKIGTSSRSTGLSFSLW